MTVDVTSSSNSYGNKACTDISSWVLLYVHPAVTCDKTDESAVVVHMWMATAISCQVSVFITTHKYLFVNCSSTTHFSTTSPLNALVLSAGPWEWKDSWSQAALFVSPEKTEIVESTRHVELMKCGLSDHITYFLLKAMRSPFTCR